MELATGNLIKSYKQCDNVHSGLVVLSTHQNSPVSILALQRDRPLIHHYQPKKEAVAKRIVLPAKMTALSVAPNGQWLACGSQQGALYVWNMRSGALKILASDAHFQAVTTLNWSRDSSVLASGGADARVLVWRTIDLINGGGPIHTLTPHTLPIVDCVFGAGIFREARLYTASEDATVTVFDVFSGRLLYTLASDATKIHCLALDPAERAIYLGGNDGVHCVPLYYEPASSTKLISVGSTDGSVVSTNSVGERVLRPESSLVVTALAVSPDASHLFVGTDEGQVSSWETGSGQLVKKYRSTKGAASQIVCTSGFDESQFEELPVLQRSIETDSLDFIPANVPEMVREPVDLDEELDEIDSYSGELASMGTCESKESTEDIEELKARHEQLQKMYDALWEKYTQK